VGKLDFDNLAASAILDLHLSALWVWCCQVDAAFSIPLPYVNAVPAILVTMFSKRRISIQKQYKP